MFHLQFMAANSFKYSALYTRATVKRNTWKDITIYYYYYYYYYNLVLTVFHFNTYYAFINDCYYLLLLTLTQQQEVTYLSSVIPASHHSQAHAHAVKHH